LICTTQYVTELIYGKKDQTSLEDMVSQTGCTVSVVEENDSNLATATRRPVHEMGCLLDQFKNALSNSDNNKSQF
jgi:hypothetical protein